MAFIALESWQCGHYQWLNTQVSLTNAISVDSVLAFPTPQKFPLNGGWDWALQDGHCVPLLLLILWAIMQSPAGMGEMWSYALTSCEMLYLISAIVST